MAEPNTRASWRFAEGDEIAPGRTALRLLGGGRRYEAYVAWDDELHALVAVKILRPDRVEDASAQAAITAEAAMLAEIAHPVIVRCFTSVLDGERPHLVLEFLDGPRLSTLLRRYGVIVEQLLPLALELCSALHYLACRRIVHFDVKPRNVIMSASPRLVDLSIAKRVDDLSSLKVPIGTDAYMAPEQCDPGRFGELGPPADIWGLGMTLYEALARTLPFPRTSTNGDGAAETTRYPQLELDPQPLPRGVPPRLAALVSSCLERRPEDRPTPAELAAELEPIAAVLPRARLGRMRPGARKQTSQFSPN